MRNSIVILFLFFSLQLWAGKVDKAYQALYQYDYFEAKKCFTKALKYNTSPAAQGLAIIYYRKDNPFHNLDSALRYVQMSLEGFDAYKPKKQLKYATYGFTRDSLLNLRAHISSAEYLKRRTANSISAYQEFIDVHTWAEECDLAIYSRDSLAFFDAVSANTSAAFQGFLSTYPQSFFIPLAKESYHELKFIEETGDGSLNSFKLFVANHPQSPLVADAQQKVFEMMTVSGSIEGYEDFIREHSTYPQVNRAWDELFQAFLVPYSLDRINAFNEKYPDHPISERVRLEIERMNEMLLPVSEGEKSLFMNHEGEIVLILDAAASRFSEGLCAVQREGKYGVVDLSGTQRVDFIYDGIMSFRNGQAIIELNDKFGVIERNGRIIMDPVFEDIGELSEGLRFASMNELYGFYNVNGTNTIMHQFVDAYNFENERAKVIFREKEALIDRFGQYVVQPYFHEIKVFNDSLFAYSENGLWGLTTADCHKITEPLYSFIGEQINGISPAIFDERVVYINEKGVILIDQGFEVFPNFAIQGAFSNDLAVVYKEEKYGRIDKSGKLINKFKYDNIGNGIVNFAAMKEGFWGVNTSNDKVVISPKFVELYFVTENTIIAKRDEVYGMIDLAEKVIIPFIYDDIEVLQDSCFLVKQNGALGVYKNGDLLLATEYSAISVFEGMILRLENEKGVTYYDLEQQRIISRVE